MKKLLPILLALLCAVTLCACGPRGDAAEPSPSGGPSPSPPPPAGPLWYSAYAPDGALVSEDEYASVFRAIDEACTVGEKGSYVADRAGNVVFVKSGVKNLYGFTGNLFYKKFVSQREADDFLEQTAGAHIVRGDGAFYGHSATVLTDYVNKEYFEPHAGAYTFKFSNDVSYYTKITWKVELTKARLMGVELAGKDAIGCNTYIYISSRGPAGFCDMGLMSGWDRPGQFRPSMTPSGEDRNGYIGIGGQYWAGSVSEPFLTSTQNELGEWVPDYDLEMTYELMADDIVTTYQKVKNGEKVGEPYVQHAKDHLDKPEALGQMVDHEISPGVTGKVPEYTTRTLLCGISYVPDYYNVGYTRTTWDPYSGGYFRNVTVAETKIFDKDGAAYDFSRGAASVLEYYAYCNDNVTLAFEDGREITSIDYTLKKQQEEKGRA